MMIISLPDKIRGQFEELIESGAALRLQQRLAVSDASIWSVSPDVCSAISQRLGWLTCIEKMLYEVSTIAKFSEKIRNIGFRHCVLLGMGGSSLAPQVFSKCFLNKTLLTLDILDNTSPDMVARLNKKLDLSKTLFIVASKSGATIESDSLFRFFYQQLAHCIEGNPGQQFVAISDEGTPLVELARQNKFLDYFINPSDIGGRFSALSYFGLIPATLVGVDIVRILESARNEQDALCGGENQVKDATKLGILLGLAANHGIDKLFIKLDESLMPFASWLEQLIAESTGKLGKGILPVINLNSQINEKHNNKHRVEVFLQKSFHDKKSIVYSQQIDEYQLGAEFFKWEWVVAIAGAIMNINPFDEPNVSESKQVTLEMLELAKNNIVKFYAKDRLTFNVDDQRSDSSTLKNNFINKLNRLIESAAYTDYFAILAYCSNGPAIENVVEDFRINVSHKKGIVTTFGIGPRYLHSTGQLHKGGANNGVFLLITTEFSNEIDIPDKDYDFGVLNYAQAMGDLKILKCHDRRAIHIHLPDESKQTLARFKEFLSLSITAANSQ